MKRLLNMFVGLAVALGALQAQNVVSVDNEMDMLYVSLENKTEFSGFQMDLRLPDGFEVLDIQLCEGRKTEGHNLSYNVQGDGSVRMVSFSNVNGTFKGVSGALVQVKVALPAAPEEGDYEVALSNVIFTTPKAVEYRLSDTKGEICYYQVDLKSNGYGSVTGAGVYLEDTKVTVSATPDEGYHFVKWSDGATVNPYTFAASQSKVLTAEFAPNTYYVTYMVDGAVMKKEPVLYGAAITLAEIPTKEGHTFSGWQGVVATMPARDVTISGTFTVNKYLVTFKIGDKVISSASLAFGSAIIAPDAPAKEGHTFLGWGDVLETVPSRDVVFEGSYKANSYQLTYTVDGESVKTESVVYGTAITLLEAPVKEGHTFSGWQGVVATMPARDVTISGAFTVNKYKVSFVIDGEEIDSKSLAFGSAIVAPDAPAKEGHTFLGWGEVLETVPSRDVVFEGSYKANSYQLTYTVDGESVKTESVVYGTAITLLEAPVKEGHTFSGWQGVVATMPARDVTISGTFTVNKYKVSFVIDGEEIDSKSLAFGSAIVVPDAPAKEGHTFLGGGEVLETVPSRDVVFEGSYKANSYQLTYTVDGESVKTESVVYGTAITLLEAPVKEGHTFSGWQGVVATMPARDVTISGTFTVNKYKVSFVIDGEEIDSKSLAFGSAIVAPDAPAKEGHTFLGWGEVLETVPSRDVVFEGSYKANSYQLTYTVDGESVKTESVVYGTAITLLEAPVKEGHTFSGWQGVVATMPARDVTISGTFTVNKYKVSFVIDGEEIDSKSLAFGSAIVAPDAPAKEGHTFLGWGEVLETVPSRDVVFEGSYKANSYQLTYTVDGESVKTESVVYGTAITLLEAPVKEGHTFSGWQGVVATMPARDVTISGTFTVNKYKVTFMIDDEVVASVSLEYGTLIEVPKVQEREGYTFSGWKNVLEVVPAHDVEYNASYVVNEYKVLYFVDGELVHSETVTFGDTIPEYIYEPTAEGEIFIGWIGDKYETMPAHDVTYEAEIKIADNIEALGNDNAQLVVYDLAGQKILVDDVRKLSKGLYIINGRRVLIK